MGSSCWGITLRSKIKCWCIVYTAGRIAWSQDGGYLVTMTTQNSIPGKLCALKKTIWRRWFLSLDWKFGQLIFSWNLPGNRALSYSDFYLVNKLMHLECLHDREAWWNWTYRRWKATPASAKQTLQVILKISLNQVCFSRLVKVIITTAVSLHACVMSCLSTAWIDDFSMLPFEWTWGWAGCACFESKLLLFLCKLC